MAVELGKKVKVVYTGTLDDGVVFGSSPEGAPLEFEVGADQVIPGVDQAVQQMSLGEIKKFRIGVNDAYGDHDPELIIKTDASQLGGVPELGQQILVPDADGNSTLLTVKSVSDEEILLDANHPLAGKDLNFELELVEVL
ncbi:FKBP-type peptidyl-prolyl cis-trans isomerase [uncultured Desulfuromusa sp.]|uniref:FKBP-type peptidyl-prolyl cis-trans isomerase n=1 Tax=uncultured Desulfuromusa sp. TaxID=219183 RepID=UPI002AA66443|nr:FKBP-type peptidyl-prolyl cis-trans isomerase [uncultured Desulfuromusa sp.]